MPYVLTVATREERDAIVATLREGAHQRSRVAQKAAGEVREAEAAAKAAGRREDLRPAALKITRFLGEANLLSQYAELWERAEEVPLEDKVEVELANGVAPITGEELPLDDDPPVPGKVDTAAGIAAAAANIDAAIGAKVADDGPTYDAGADTDEPVEGNDPNPEGE